MMCWSGSFPYRVYIDSSHHDTLGYETACHCCHLVVCLVYCLWIRGVGYGCGYDYIIIMIIVFTYL
jgi:hypothetical protein